LVDTCEIQAKDESRLESGEVALVDGDLEKRIRCRVIIRHEREVARNISTATTTRYRVMFGPTETINAKDVLKNICRKDGTTVSDLIVETVEVMRARSKVIYINAYCKELS